MIRATAHGKVNAMLGVGEAGDDGYHDLVTVFHALNVRETIALTEADDPANPKVTVAGPYASSSIPCDDRNLARKAVSALAQATDTHVPVDIAIDKNVPVAGGMGGGSADAAAALVAYAAWIGLDDPQLLHDTAATLGADVPFALMGGTAIGTGRGDELATVMSDAQFHWVLATSASELSTPNVYGRLDQMRAEGRAPGPTLDAEAAVAAFVSGDPHQLAEALHNDLEAAACDMLPQLREVLETGREAEALGGLVSGSGPTVAFLVEDDTHALDLAVMLEASTSVRNVVRTSGPASGAHVVED